MNKYFIILLISFLVFMSLSACAKKYDYQPKLIIVPYNFSDFIETVPIAVECEVLEKTSSFDSEIGRYHTFDVKVNDVFRGEDEIKKNETVSILQEGFDYVKPLEKGDKLILLLLRYDGVVTTDRCYFILGINAGQITIENSKLKPKALSAGKLYEDILKYDMKAFKELLKTKPYKPVKKISIDEIKKANENEKRLQQEALKKKNQ